MATGVRPVTATREPSASRTWQRAVHVVAAAVLIVLSVSAQAVDLTPVAIALLIVAIVTLAPLALPSVDQ